MPVDSFAVLHHHHRMITNSCTVALSKKFPVPGH